MYVQFQAEVISPFAVDNNILVWCEQARQVAHVQKTD